LATKHLPDDILVISGHSGKAMGAAAYLKWLVAEKQLGIRKFSRVILYVCRAEGPKGEGLGQLYANALNVPVYTTVEYGWMGGFPNTYDGVYANGVTTRYSDNARWAVVRPGGVGSYLPPMPIEYKRN
jgi:hypothetical protein